MILRAALLAVCLTGIPAPARSDEAAAIRSIDDLWSGFDPRSLPLEIEVIKSWDEGDVHLETIYFTGEEFEGEKTRIFGYLGRPKKMKGPLPAVLHLHGGGQTAVLDWPRFWAPRGYACLSFDFCGDTNLPELGPGYRREHFTRWGKAPANMLQVSGGLNMKPTPRQNPWYHWMLAARRGLTLLESQPDVDASRMGIFGISVGGTLTWGVAAVDSRVKAAAPIYGCGWEFYQYPPDTTAPVDDDLRLWRTLIAPEAHADRITCPLLWLNATNDGHGRMDLGFRTLDLTKSSVRSQVFTANYDHHIEPVEARSLPLFMDRHLKGEGDDWPATPAIEIAPGTVPVVRVSPDRPADVNHVDIYYCLNNDWPTTRFWRTCPTVRCEGDSFAGDAPFLSEDDLLIAFANVSYRSGVRISSKLAKSSVRDLSGARPSLQREPLIDAMDTSTDWAWVPAYTDPCRDDAFFGPWTGPDGEQGFTLNTTTFNHAGATSYYFGTRKIGDPQFCGSGRTTLLIDHPADSSPESLTVRVRHRLPGQNPLEFTAQPQPGRGENSWRTISMTADQFVDAGGNLLPNWDHVEHFILEGKNPAGHPPVFKRLRWAD
jgi:dienelactone hydrolase